MYDRATNTIWNQFTGVPVIGPLADSGIRLSFFPAVLTTWEEWLDEHPDTTVISRETPFYESRFYVPESDSSAIYNDYFTSPDTRFPVWNRSDALETKEVVLGLEIGNAYKAYPVEALQKQLVINDTLGGADVVLIGSSASQAARAYEREGRLFSLAGQDAAGALPDRLVDGNGVAWRVTEEYLVNESDPSQKLSRIPTHTSFWFGWFAFHPDTLVYSP